MKQGARSRSPGQTPFPREAGEGAFEWRQVFSGLFLQVGKAAGDPVLYLGPLHDHVGELLSDRDLDFFLLERLIDRGNEGVLVQENPLLPHGDTARGRHKRPDHHQEPRD